MKNLIQTQTTLQMILLVLTASVFNSCSQTEFEPVTTDKNPTSSRAEMDSLPYNARIMTTDPNCESDCITEESGNYFYKRGTESVASGNNTKEVSYVAYNTEDDFIVEVSYNITTGKAKGKATINIDIGDKSKSFSDISSGTTIYHSISLAETWSACDEINFTISQTGMGKPIIFSEIYGLIPVCVKISTVTIGTQTWMQENLDVSVYKNGDPIPQVQDPAEWATLTTGAWCYFGNNSENGKIYGKLYNWYAVNDPRGLAPEGWHVPSNDEWEVLTTFLGGISAAGGKLKTTGTIESGTGLWRAPNVAATNETGFSLVPGGMRFPSGEFFGIGTVGALWTTTQIGPASSWSRQQLNVNGTLYLNGTSSGPGYSVRCLMDLKMASGN